jgi:hypothetical protein
MNGTVNSSDTYLDKLKKSMPGEVTALYLSLKLLATDRLIGGRTPDPTVIMDYLKVIIPVICVMLVVAAVYLYAMDHIRNPVQIGVTVVSLFIWAVAMDISYLSQAAEVYRLPWLFDVLARNSVLFLMLVFIWNFSIPMIYALQDRISGVRPPPPGQGVKG